MRRMQCNVEFGYQIGICSSTDENHGKPWLSLPVAGPSVCILTSSQQFGIKYAYPNGSLCCCFIFKLFTDWFTEIWSSYKYLAIQFLPQRKQRVWIKCINWLKLFKRIIGVYTDNRMKPINALCGQNSELFNVKAWGTGCIRIHNCDNILVSVKLKAFGTENRGGKLTSLQRICSQLLFRFYCVVFRGCWSSEIGTCKSRSTFHYYCSAVFRQVQPSTEDNQGHIFRGRRGGVSTRHPGKKQNPIVYRKRLHVCDF
jgi:hypothetical protein